MRVFVTGATGYIGKAVARTFREKGHTVYGLIRAPEQKDDVSQHEIWPVVGNIENPESYAKVLDEVEVVVHCAFDSSDQAIERDAKLIDVVVNKFSKSPLPHTFIYTSGVWIYGSTGSKIVDEASPVNPLDTIKWRPEHEQKVLKATSPNLRTVVIRPGMVYGESGGLTDLIFNSSQNGSIAIPGNGHTHWAMVHVQDLAHAYVSAAEKELTNVILNVVDDANPTLQEIGEAIAKRAGVDEKVINLSSEEGEKQFGHLIKGLTIDQKVNNARIKRLLGWQIHHASFVDDMDIYYHAWKANQHAK